MNFPAEIKQIKQYLSTGNSTAKVRVPFAEGVELPVYILGSSTDSAHLAAEMGLPYAFASHFAPAQLKEALAIYKTNFKPSVDLAKPYSIAAVNVIISPTNELAEQELTSLVRMFYGVLTGVPDFIQPPEVMTAMLRQVWEHPQVQQMLKYTFYGDREKVKGMIDNFMSETGVDELMVVSNQFSHRSRIETFRGFSEIMKELNKAQ